MWTILELNKILAQYYLFTIDVNKYYKNRKIKNLFITWINSYRINYDRSAKLCIDKNQIKRWPEKKSRDVFEELCRAEAPDSIIYESIV